MYPSGDSSRTSRMMNSLKRSYFNLISTLKSTVSSFIYYFFLSLSIIFQYFWPNIDNIISIYLFQSNADELMYTGNGSVMDSVKLDSRITPLIKVT